MAGIAEKSVVRENLERSGVAALRLEGYEQGHIQLLLDFVDGHLQWYELRPVRTPPSRLDELARGAGAGAVSNG